MGFTSDLTAGVAQLLAAANVASWSPSAAYASGVTGIVVGKMPPSPDAAVALMTYAVSDDPTLSDSVTGLQVMTRTGGADPTTTNDLSDAIFDQLHGLSGVTLSTGVRVVMCERRSGVSLGQDDLKRWVRSDNYYATCWRPSPHRT
jgi:hypothetical protein